MEEYCGENTLMKCLSKYNCLGVTVLPLKERTHRRIGKARVTPAAAAKSLQSCPTLCNPIDGSPPGSPVPGTLQARILEWAAISFSSVWKWKVKVKSLSCIRLSDPMDCSLAGFSTHGSFQARVLEWGAIAFSEEWPLQRWIRMVASL